MKLTRAVAILGCLLFSHTAKSASPYAYAQNGCTPNETWQWSKEIPPEFIQEFEGFLSGKRSEVTGFSDALALRKTARSAEAKIFSEYWISRALYQAKLYHIAQVGLSRVASRSPDANSVGIQTAALECLLKIQQNYPTLRLSGSVAKILPEYQALSKIKSQLPVLWEAAHEVLRTQLFENASASQIQTTLSLLNGAGPYESLAKAWVASKRNEHSVAIQESKRFLSTPSYPQSLKRYLNQTHILLARSYYALKQFEAAADHYKHVSKGSNELASSLSELTWAYLMEERYSEAIGTAINLQAGGLRRTYAPEAPMVMAMALNELCQYPESVRSVNLFRKFYEDSFHWLSAWSKDPNLQKEPLYPLAIEYLKKRGKTPERIASEWVKSPLFISNQSEINLIFDEQENANRLGKSGAEEQNRTALTLIEQLKKLTPRYKAAKAKQKLSEQPHADFVRLMPELRATRDQLRHYRRMQQAAPVWRSILATHQKEAPIIKTQRVAEINDDLKRRSTRMHEQLEEIAENVELIEVEIFNGASQDIIWQNAHPDYKQVAKKLTDPSGDPSNPAQRSADQTWNWGKTSVVSDESMEIWEDELGSFQANLFDNCSSKDRYLALKTKEKTI